MKSEAMPSEVLRIETVRTPDGWTRISQWWQRLARLGGRAPRHLRLAESLALGDRRFVAVIEYERVRFLVGGTSTSMVLLARLDREGDPIPDPSIPRPARQFERERP